MLASARSDLGLSGRPNRITKSYAARNGTEYLRAEWCDMSITEWARKSGNAAAVLPNGDRAYTVWHAQDGQELGLWYAGTAANIRKHAKPGAIVFFDWGGTDRVGAIDHVGIVERNLGDGRVQTIEGNTGDACKRRVRGPSVIAGFWNPPYGKEDDMPLTDADAKKVAREVIASLTGTVKGDHWAAKEGLMEPGKKLTPLTFIRQAWAYGKGCYGRLGRILTRMDAQDAELKALREEVAALRGTTPPAAPTED